MTLKKLKGDNERIIGKSTVEIQGIKNKGGVRASIEERINKLTWPDDIIESERKAGNIYAIDINCGKGDISYKFNLLCVIIFGKACIAKWDSGKIRKERKQHWKLLECKV